MTKKNAGLRETMNDGCCELNKVEKNRKKMTYLRIERKRPRESIQNQHEIVVSSTGDMKTAEAIGK